MYLIGEIWIVCILQSTELLQIILDFKPVKNRAYREAILSLHPFLLYISAKYVDMAREIRGQQQE